jgi:hypothetical protein
MSYSRIVKSKAGLQIATEDSGSNIVLAPNNGEIHLAGTAVLSSALGIQYGGTGGSNASEARTALGITPANLNLIIGTDVQAHSSKLQDIADLVPSNGDHLEWDGANWVGATHSEEATTASGALEKTGNDITVKALGITNAMLAGSIDASKLNSITVSKISDYLAQGAINNANMFSAGVVDSEHIASGAVDASHVNTSQLPTLSDNNTFSGVNSFSGAVVESSANAWGDSRSLAYSVSTNDNSKTTLASYILGANECVLVEANVSARDQTSFDVNAYKLSFVCKRESAASSAVFPAGASQDNLEIIHESDGTWNCEARANVTTGGFDISVYGDSTNSVHWACTVVVTRVA